MGLFHHFATKRNLLNESSEKPILDAIYNDDVRKTFKEFVRLSKGSEWCLIGGLALGAFTRPRNTNDIDIVVLNDSDINELVEKLKSSFKITRKHAMVHKSTGVEIEVLTPDYINQSSELIKGVIDNAKNDGGIKVATPKYLIALKLGRAKGTGPKANLDRADIQNLVEQNGKQDISDLGLSDEEINLYNKLIKDMV